MANQTVDEIKPILLGNDWRMELEHSPVSGDVQVWISSKITIDRQTALAGDSNLRSILFEKISAAIESTPIFKTGQASMAVELKSVRDKLVQAENEIERLKQFENHFQVEMRLRHGVRL